MVINTDWMVKELQSRWTITVRYCSHGSCSLPSGRLGETTTRPSNTTEQKCRLEYHRAKCTGDRSQATAKVG